MKDLLSFENGARALLTGVFLNQDEEMWPAAMQALTSAARLASPDVRSVAVFLADGEHLGAVSGSGPDQERLEHRGLLGLREPMVERCWESRSVLGWRTAAEDEDRRIFRDAGGSLAFPLPEVGVLYVGRSAEAFADSECERLEKLAIVCHPILAVARRLDVERQELSESRTHAEFLRQWAESLDRLNRSNQDMGASLEEGRILDEVGPVLSSLFPGRDWALCYGQATLGNANPNPAVLQQTTAAVLSRGALWLDAKGAALWPGQCELLGASLQADKETLGALLVGRTQSLPAFTRPQRNLLTLLAYQIGGALHNARLHREVKEAYQQLQDSRAQLLQSSKLAAVGELAAGMAHEVNTPLGSILLLLDSTKLVFQNNPARAIEKLDLAKREIQRVHGLVEKLLYYSRDARTGRQAVRWGQILTDTLELSQHSLSMHQIEVEIEVADDPPVWGNANELQQVLTNLLMNARDAMPEGGTVRVTVTVEGETVCLSVRDAGSGIPQEIQERIFDAFFTTKEVGEGTGLGLSVSRQIVSQHDGELALRPSGPGGATFEIRLPIYPVSGET